MNKKLFRILFLIILFMSFSTIILTADRANSHPLDNWHTRTAPTSANLKDVIYAKGIFVAVGEGGTLITSDTGEIWTKIDLGITTNLRGIAFQNNLFFALGENGLMLTSPDGISWQPKTLNPGILYDIVYVNGKYVVCGWDYIANSIDLNNWSYNVSYTPPKTLPSAYTLAYGEGLFLFGGESGDIYSSPDGISWTRRLMNGCYIGKILKYSDKFYAVGCDTPGASFFSAGYHSLNGLDWIQIGQLTTSDIVNSDITSNSNMLVVVVSYGTIKSSHNGIDWTTHHIPSTNYWSYKVAYGENTFVVVSENGSIFQSDPLIYIYLPVIFKNN